MLSNGTVLESCQGGALFKNRAGTVLVQFQASERSPKVFLAPPLNGPSWRDRLETVPKP